MLEIGGGRGALTERLCRSANHLKVIELDPAFVSHLRRLLPDTVELEHGDALRTDLTIAGAPKGALRLVGNLPYSISSQLISRILLQNGQNDKGQNSDGNRLSGEKDDEKSNGLGNWQDAHFLVQREVAERLTAKPGQRNWGRLGVLAQMVSDSEKLFDVPPQAFDPPPKVHSSLVRIKACENDYAGTMLMAQVLDLARTLFSARRKSLSNALRPALGKSLDSLQVDKSMRAEHVSLDILVAAARLLPEPEADARPRSKSDAKP